MISVNWKFNVLEMTLKTSRFVQGLPRTPLLFSSIFQNQIFQIDRNKRKISEIRKSGNPKTQIVNLQCLSIVRAQVCTDGTNTKTIVVHEMWLYV